MAQLTAPPRRPGTETVRKHLPAFLTGLRAGAAATTVGVLVLALPAVLLWIASPRVDESLDDALHLASCLWLAAHGTELTRTAAVDGQLTPIGLTPMLLMLLPCWVLYRAGALIRAQGWNGGGRGGGTTPAEDPQNPYDWLLCLAGLLLGYLGLTLLFALTVSGDGGGIGVEPLPAMLRVLVLAVPVAAAGVWRACGGADGLRAGAGTDEPWQPRVWHRWFRSAEATSASAAHGAGGQALRPALPLLPKSWTAPAAQWLRARQWLRTNCPDGTPAVLRAASAALLALGGGGALLAGYALARAGRAPGAGITALADDAAGALSLLLLGLLLLPNAMVWTVSYAIGTGFAVGQDARVGPAGSAAGQLPEFPLTTAVPTAGGSGWAWAAVVVPVAAGGVLAAFLGRAAGPAAGAGAGVGTEAGSVAGVGTAVGIAAPVAGAGIAAMAGTAVEAAAGMTGPVAGATAGVTEPVAGATAAKTEPPEASRRRNPLSRVARVHRIPHPRSWLRRPEPGAWARSLTALRAPARWTAWRTRSATFLDHLKKLTLRRSATVPSGVGAVGSAESQSPATATSEAAARWSVLGTLLATTLAALLCGAVAAVLAGLSGGPLGTRNLQEFGPPPVLTGLVTAGWLLTVAGPTALLLRVRLRRRVNADAASPPTRGR
jgi:hypothetical protein